MALGKPTATTDHALAATVYLAARHASTSTVRSSGSGKAPANPVRVVFASRGVDVAGGVPALRPDGALPERGRAGGLAAVLAFHYDDDRAGSPWEFVLYLDDHADDRRRAPSHALFTGALGGPPLAQFRGAFKASRQLGVRCVPIEVEHHERRAWFRAGECVMCAPATRSTTRTR